MDLKGKSLFPNPLYGKTAGKANVENIGGEFSEMRRCWYIDLRGGLWYV
jgi:hypothetical protein